MGSWESDWLSGSGGPSGPCESCGSRWDGGPWWVRWVWGVLVGLVGLVGRCAHGSVGFGESAWLGGSAWLCGSGLVCMGCKVRLILGTFLLFDLIQKYFQMETLSLMIKKN